MTIQKKENKMKMSNVCIILLVGSLAGVADAAIVTYSSEEQAIQVDFSGELSSNPFEPFKLQIDFDNNHLGYTGFFSTINNDSPDIFLVGNQDNPSPGAAGWDYINPDGTPDLGQTATWPWNTHSGPVSADTGYMYVYSDYWNISSGNVSLYIKPVYDGNVTDLTSTFYFADDAELIGDITGDRWQEYTVIPEPASLSLIGLVAGGLYFFRRVFTV